MTTNNNPTRCEWCLSDPLYIEYHDKHWGVPVHDDQELFAMLCLEGAQAGLSWITILKKMPHYRLVFHDFEIQTCTKLNDDQLNALLTDPGIVRNRLKVFSVRKNAQAALRIIRDQGSLSTFLWSFVQHKTIVNNWKSLSQCPASTPESDAMSKALKKAGMSFTGSTICYAFMQSTGMVNDHMVDCYRWSELK